MQAKIVFKGVIRMMWKDNSGKAKYVGCGLNLLFEANYTGTGKI